MGSEAAEVLMKAFPPIEWTDFATKSDIDARLAKHTLVIIATNVATLISLAGIAIAIAQIYS